MTEDRTMSSTLAPRRRRPIAAGARLARTRVVALAAALCLAGTGLLAAAAPQEAHAGEHAIAIVDLQKVLLSTKEGKAAKAKFEALQNKKKKQLKRKDDELKQREKGLLAERVAIEKELAEAAKRGATSIPDDLKAKAQAFQQKIMAFQKEVMDFQGAQKEALDGLAKKESELLKPIEDKIRKHIEAIAKERGFSAVLSRVAVVYALDAIDITDEVSKRIGK